jgi:hypothetical protein
MNKPLAAIGHVIFGSPVAHAVTLMLGSGLSDYGCPGDQRDPR